MSVHASIDWRSEKVLEKIVRVMANAEKISKNRAIVATETFEIACF